MGLIAPLAVHPGKVRLLERVEFAMEFHGGDGASRLLIDLLLAGKAPIVGEPGDARMLLAERDLLVIQVEFRSVAPRDLHTLFSTKSALQNSSFRTGGMRKVLCGNPANQKTCSVPQSRPSSKCLQGLILQWCFVSNQ